MSKDIRNIKQFTNCDLSLDGSTSKIINKDNENLIVHYQTKHFTGVVSKLGYCCSPNGIGLPIFLTNKNNITRKIFIGQTGIFEFQPFSMKLEDEELDFIETIAEIEIISISVPLLVTNEKNNSFPINFVVDYVEENKI